MKGKKTSGKTSNPALGVDDTDTTLAPTCPRPKPRPTGKGRKKASKDIAPPENVDIIVEAQPECQTLMFEPGIDNLILIHR